MNRANNETFSNLNSFNFKKAMDNNNIRESILNSRASLQSSIGPTSDFNFDSRASLLRQPPAHRKESKIVTNKLCQKENITKIINFLSKNCYQPTITGKVLNLPSQITFSQVFQFIYGYLDQNFVAPSKFDPDVYLKALKGIGYISNIPRSAFTFGSITSWHHLMAIFAWMVDYIEIALEGPSEIYTLFKFENSVDEAVVHSYKFELYREIYKDHCDNEGKSITNICEDHAELYATNDRAKCEGEDKRIIEMEDELRHLTLSLEEMERLKQKRIDAEKESRELSVYREKSRNHLRLVQEEHEKAVAISDLLESKFYEAQGKNEELKIQLVSQTQIIGDLNEFKDKRNTLNQEITSIRGEITQFTEANSAEEVTTAQLIDKVKGHCEGIISKLIKLHHYPINVSGQVLELRPSQIDRAMLVLLREHLMADVKGEGEACERLKVECTEKSSRLEQLVDGNEKRSERGSDLRIQNEALEKQFRSRKDLLDREAGIHAKAFNKMAGTVDRAKAESQKFRLSEEGLLQLLADEVSRIIYSKERYANQELVNDDFFDENECLVQDTKNEMEEETQLLYEKLHDMMYDEMILD